MSIPKDDSADAERGEEPSRCGIVVRESADGGEGAVGRHQPLHPVTAHRDRREYRVGRPERVVRAVEV